MIRTTYANFSQHNSQNWTLFFVLGRPINDSYLEEVRRESQSFGDIVVANVNETYEDLTFKTLIGLKVVTCFCLNAEYVIKTDDDVYLLPRKFEQVFSDLSGKE